MTHVKGDFGCDVFFPVETMNGQGFTRVENLAAAENSTFSEMAAQNPNTEEGVTYDFCCYTRK